LIKDIAILLFFKNNLPKNDAAPSLPIGHNMHARCQKWRPNELDRESFVAIRQGGSSRFYFDLFVAGKPIHRRLNMTTKKSALTLALGSAMVLSTVAAPVAAGENPFAADQLARGYMVAQSDKAMEGKCGEGKCGAKPKAKEGKCGEGKCGAKPKAKEGKCGEGKCGAKPKAMEGKCGEGKCGAKPKAKEGKCGEGKCGTAK
jgi:uncharacterized low-complexity protein